MRLGIQKGKDVIQDIDADAPEVTFEVPMRVARNAHTGQPNFMGSYAHGTPDERFIYLCWGEYGEFGWDGFRRAKLQLNHLTWDTLDKSLESGEPIRVTINMTDGKGGPLCATIKADKVQWHP